MSEMVAKKPTAKPATEAAQYGKAQLLRSKTFKERADLLQVLLAEDKSYTKAEVTKLIEEYDRKEV